MYLQGALSGVREAFVGDKGLPDNDTQGEDGYRRDQPHGPFFSPVSRSYGLLFCRQQIHPGILTIRGLFDNTRPGSTKDVSPAQKCWPPNHAALCWGVGDVQAWPPSCIRRTDDMQEGSFACVTLSCQNIVFSFADVSGTACNTSQCSTIFPSSLNRKTSTAACSFPIHSGYSTCTNARSPSIAMRLTSQGRLPASCR